MKKYKPWIGNLLILDSILIGLNTYKNTAIEVIANPRLACKDCFSMFLNERSM